MSLITASKIVCKYLSYPLTQEDGSKHYIQLPLVHVILESRVEKVGTDALVDSGATSTFVPKEIADTISLLPADTTSVRQSSASGAGGRFPTDVVHLKRLTLIKNVTPFAHFVEVLVHIPKEEGKLPYVILGRDHIFPKFDITFHENRRKFTCTRI
jgi:hypothetical protein